FGGAEGAISGVASELLWMSLIPELRK
ncbi:MAG: hypothetical protein RL741_707, partial [Actinomycetota bacterium]